MLKRKICGSLAFNARLFFIERLIMMGDIQKACNNYNNLLNCEYYFILGKNGKKVHLKLAFSKYEFFHLSGLHKLTDIEYFNHQNSKMVFDNILNGRITQKLCQTSTIYSQIDDRIALIENLENFLDSNKTIFKYNNKINLSSRINADFILKNEDIQRNLYVYISKSDTTPDIYYCRSAFPRDKSLSDYAAGHTSYTLLFKEKTNTLTKQKQILYTHPSYQKELEQRTAGTLPHQDDSIQKIKFDNPAPQNILHSGSGTVAAILPAPNPLKDFLAKLRQGIAELFKPKDKLSDTLSETPKTSEEIYISVISPEEDKTVEAVVVPEKTYSDELSAIINVRERFIANEIELPEYARAWGIYMFSLKSSEECEQVKEILQNQLSECSGDNERTKCINTELRELKRYSNKHFSPHPKQTLDDLIEYARVEREKRDNEAMKAEPKEKQTTKSNDYYER